MWHFSKEIFSYWETTFTLVGTTASITFVILELKWCARPLTENLEREGVEEKSWINVTGVLSNVVFWDDLRYITLKLNTVMIRGNKSRYKNQMFSPLEIIKSRMWPLLCVGCITVWVSPKLSRTRGPLSSGFLTWILKSSTTNTQS